MASLLATEPAQGDHISLEPASPRFRVYAAFGKPPTPDGEEFAVQVVRMDRSFYVWVGPAKRTTQRMDNLSAALCRTSVPAATASSAALAASSSSSSASVLGSPFPPPPPFLGVMSGLGKLETEVLMRGYGDLNR